MATVFDIVETAIMALRAYAVNGKDWRIPSVIVALFLVEIACNIYETGTLRIMNSPYGCFPEDTNNLADLQIHAILMYAVEVNIASVITALLAHLLLLVETWRRTFKTKRFADSIGEQASITNLLLVDGTVFFGTIFAFDILDVVIMYTKNFKGFGAFQPVLTGIPLSRFFLNLRNAVDSRFTTTGKKRTTTQKVQGSSRPEDMTASVVMFRPLLLLWSWHVLPLEENENLGSKAGVPGGT
ncbi:uncharacterized protein B0H18DRAFT_1127133 [Fomitopsis serialis]|uniref:uncharacterized protein n=1 Tax=Fomitopsis serialis TaxID=139415 RepID=UPI002008269D|nr:uncharacterized protein B0H18DRAFT_1127133 [Neoantrodia serialis]KAH9912496.1 hypothetical protein B0H18DRAFT_1127133 [Neoantrodia serialis]